MPHDYHDHAHGHSHALGHAHAPNNFGVTFGVGIALNVGFVAIEAIYGVLANSMALLADAWHNLSDVLGLLIAWGAAVLAKRLPTARYTYGLRSSSILAALANAIFVLVAVGAIAWEAIRRFAEAQPVAGTIVMVVAAIGIGVNGVTAWVFASGRKGDLNIKGAFLHMAADAAVSAGVVAAGLVMFFTGWAWLDPAVSLAIAAVIIWGTWGLLRDSVNMSLNAVPPGIDPAEVRAYLESLSGVTRIHDLHIWPMSTTETALTCHLVIPTAIRATCTRRGSRANCTVGSASVTRPCKSRSTRMWLALSNRSTWCEGEIPARTRVVSGSAGTRRSTSCLSGKGGSHGVPEAWPGLPERVLDRAFSRFRECHVVELVCNIAELIVVRKAIADAR